LNQTLLFGAKNIAVGIKHFCLGQRTLRFVSNTSAWGKKHCGWHQTLLFGAKNTAFGIKHICLGQKTLRLASNTSVWGKKHCGLYKTLLLGVKNTAIGIKYWVCSLFCVNSKNVRIGTGQTTG
jgi:hypothetical protein